MIGLLVLALLAPEGRDIMPLVVIIVGLVPTTIASIFSFIRSRDTEKKVDHTRQEVVEVKKAVENGAVKNDTRD
jgi:high-affinity K+ transport system ATPase subunit B